MNVSAVLDRINKPNVNQGDYTGDDGLLYCGVCHEPKQTRGTGVMSGKLLFITCDCQKKAIAEEEREKKRVKADELRSFCFANKAMAQHTFSVASDAKHIQIAKRYVAKWEEVKSKNLGLLLWGNTGTGKSFTAHCIANALIEQLVPVRLYSSVQVINDMMDRDLRAKLMEKVRTVPLVILDDVGAERNTPFAREQLCAIIDERNEAGLPLIVTTNYTLSDMDKTADQELQRVFDRIRSMCVAVAVTGESKRRAVGAQKLREAREILGAGEI